MYQYVEKSESCPRCGEVKKWLYDAQICAACHYPKPSPGPRVGDLDHF